jgi:hypothetical protein
MAEHCARTDGEHGSHPVPLSAEAAMTHRKDTAMNAVEAFASQASVPALAADTRLLELSEGDDAVLPGRDSRDGCIRVGVADFRIHVDA